MGRWIAITGPDGSGKTTVCEQLSAALQGAQVEYGGKARNHKLKSTRFAYRVLSAAKSLWGPLYFPFCYLWFYFFEFAENRTRFSESHYPPDADILFDRHPLDRMVMPADIDLKREQGTVPYLQWLLEKPPRIFWSGIYHRFFDVPVQVFVLLPTPELCFTRSQGQYRSEQDAWIRIESYRRTLPTLPHPERYVGIPVTAETSVTDIVQTILHKLSPPEAPVS